MLATSLLLALAAFAPDPLLPASPYALKGHKDAVVAIAFSPDGTLLASAGRDKVVHLWSLQTGEVVRTIAGAEEQLMSVAFSADGKRLAIGDVGLHARVLDVATGALVKALAHPDGIAQVALDADGSALAVAGLTDHGVTYDVATGAKRFGFRGRTARFADDGKALLVSSADGSFSLLDPKTGKARKTVKTAPERPLTTMTPSGATIASWTAGGLDVKVWTAAGAQVALLKGPVADLERRKAYITGVALTPDGKRVAVSGADGLLRLWSVEKASLLTTWPADKTAAVAISHDGAWVAVADSTVVKLWKLP